MALLQLCGSHSQVQSLPPRKVGHAKANWESRRRKIVSRRACILEFVLCGCVRLGTAICANGSDGAEVTRLGFFARQKKRQNWVLVSLHWPVKTGALASKCDTGGHSVPSHPP